MRFPHGETVFRDRRASIPDPYNPDRIIPGDFDPDLTIELSEAFVASSSSTAPQDATRSQILTTKSLYLSEPGADVLPGDRIRVGGVIDDFDTGVAYMVEVVPVADVNPFTGWQPVLEVPLENAEG